jgi:hypothetical protein
MDNADDWEYEMTTLFLERLMDPCPPANSTPDASWTENDELSPIRACLRLDKYPWIA